VVVADGPEVDRVITDHLLRLDQPHLLVRSLGDAAWVGPLVLPGRTSCVRCADLTRRDADHEWPMVLAQLSRLRLPVPDLLTGWAASTAAAQALAFLAGQVPETAGATLELNADLHTELRPWPAHPECGCGWAVGTEWGP
jgi:bacteriocin biosynthesis cyclodehydratase domain-containing protein